MKKGLVLLAVNSKYIHSSLSVWVIAGGVSRVARTPYNVSVIEATIRQDDEEIAALIEARKPDVVGISVYIWNAGKLPGLLRLLRGRLPETVIILGGPEAEHNAETWLAQGADHVLSGEGEHALPALLDTLGGLGPMPPGPVEQWIDPYGEEYLKTLKGRIAYLETSRGCPFRCAFCLSAGSGVRFLPLEKAKEQIQKLARSGPKVVKLVDRTFNCDAGRAYELFETILSLDTDCRFHFEVAADLFDGRTLALLQTAPPGRLQFEAGLQSFYGPALQAVNRQSDILKAEQAIRALLQGRNIHIHLDLIAGLPYERLEAFQDSFDRAYMIGAHTLQLGFLKLLHGSVLRERAEELGIRYSQEPPYEITNSPWLSPEDLTVLKQTEDALRHTYNKGRFLSALEYALAASGLCPFTLFHTLGKTAPHNGAALEEYAGRVYGCLSTLPGVDKETLLERMICDWLGMVKGKNTPPFLKRPGLRLDRKTGRGESALLPSGRGVFVNPEDRDPVTGLYGLTFV